MHVLAAGVDCSTQSTTVLVVDAASGDVRGRGRAEHVVSGTAGVRQSDPDGWWAALAAALAQTGLSSQVGAIAIAGQQHGLVVLDAAGSPLLPAPLWNDTTSVDDTSALLAELGGPAGWAQLTGSVPTTSFTVTKWAQLRRVNSAYLNRVAKVRLPHDYLTERLCGEAVTDRGDASGTGWFSATDGEWVEPVLALPQVELRSSLLPRVLRGADAAGDVTAGAVEALGLEPGTRVAAGTGDNMATAVGLGLKAGAAVISLGTSATVFALTDRPSADPTGILAGFADATTRFLPLACTLNATLAVDRFAAWLRLDRDDVAPAGDVVVLPYLDGERTPAYPRAAGSILGLRHTTQPSEILQATYDGVIDPLIGALELLDEATTGGLDPDAPLILTGGGARGSAWRETAARLSGRQIVVPQDTELAALGAAALAVAGVTGEDPYTIARRWQRERPAVSLPSQTPDRERRERIGSVRERLHELNLGPGDSRAAARDSA
jgi:xylulokinase